MTTMMMSTSLLSSQVKKAVGGQARGMALYEDDVRLWSHITEHQTHGGDLILKHVHYPPLVDITTITA